jgi:hypothetical protein
MRTLRLDDWIDTHRVRKQRFATTLLTPANHKWSKTVFEWHPETQLQRRRIHSRKRSVGRPVRRWTDGLELEVLNEPQ